MFGEGSGADALIDALGGYDVAAEIGWKGMQARSPPRASSRPSPTSS